MQNFIGVQYDKTIEVAPGVMATFRDAGHILGSAGISLEIRENEKFTIKKIDYFSAHADQNELLEYLRLSPPEKLKNIFLVHGEEEQALPLKSKILKKRYRNVHFPRKGEVFEI